MDFNVAAKQFGDSIQFDINGIPNTKSAYKAAKAEANRIFGYPSGASRAPTVAVVPVPDDTLATFKVTAKRLGDSVKYLLVEVTDPKDALRDAKIEANDIFDYMAGDAGAPTVSVVPIPSEPMEAPEAEG